jgi:hypothetical protein
MHFLVPSSSSLQWCSRCRACSTAHNGTYPIRHGCLCSSAIMLCTPHARGWVISTLIPYNNRTRKSSRTSLSQLSDPFIDYKNPNRLSTPCKGFIVSIVANEGSLGHAFISIRASMINLQISVSRHNSRSHHVHYFTEHSEAIKHNSSRK